MSKDCANEVQVTSTYLDKLRIFQCSYKWDITSFSKKKYSRGVETAPFTVENRFRTSFSLRLDRPHSLPDPYFVYLMKKDGICGQYYSFLFNTEFSILDCNYVKRFITCSEITSSSAIGRSRFFTERDLCGNPELLNNDTLTILCKFQLVLASEELHPVSTTSSILQDLKSLFDQRRNADVILQIGDQSVEAHKFVLTTRSSVFAAMFENEMRESKENKVKITDMTKDVLEEFLRYMYTDETPNLKTMAMGLLGAAEKYHVESLKRRCENHLLETVTVEDAAEILINADLYNAEGLKKGVIRFIYSNKKAFVETEGYKTLRKSHGRLVPELFEADVSN